MIKLLCKKMPIKWILLNYFSFVKSIMFVLVSVTGEISSGAINIAEENLEFLVKLFSQKLNPVDVDESFIDIQQKAIFDVLRELIRQVGFSSSHFLIN